MNPLDLLNALAENVFNLKNENSANDFKKYVSPNEWPENTYKNIGGQLIVISKEEYLKDCIGAFLVYAQAFNKTDVLKGIEETKQMVKFKKGFGMVDDIEFTVRNSNNSTKTHKIRIFGVGRSVIGYEERDAISYWTNLGDYVIVNSLEEFYDWYVDKFGKISLNY